jgi:hypothetical protein
VFQKGDGKEVDAGIAQRGGSFAVGPLSSAASVGSTAIDDAGDGVAAFAPSGSGATGAQARGFDATPPTIQTESIPPAALAGRAAAFSATATDFWGSVSLSWNFGDGSVASGASVSHVFSTPGARTVSVTATDAVGNSVARTGRIVVSAVVPVLSRVSETHSAFKVGSSSTALNAAARRRRKVPTGTRFLFTLNELARVSLTITHGASGRVSHGRCVKPSRRLASHRACTLRVVDGVLVRRGLTGANRVAFSGRLGRHALAPGSYTVTFGASSFGVAARSHALKFSIVR